jgi:response regulator RpfG family c-di-GMP phosphodiesterase
MNNPLDFVTKKTILVVDDTSDNLSLMSGLLKDQYRVKLANSGEKALKAVQGDNPPDLILLDIMMPGMSGYEVCQVLKADPATRPIPIIFLTAMTSMEDEQKGLEFGAADYITKPISPPIVLARVKTQLENKAMADFLRDQAAFLKAEVERQTQMVRAVQDATNADLAKVDLLISPTTPHTAFELGREASDPTVMYLEDIFTVQAPIAGLPALSLPMGLHSNGLPMGLHLTAKAFDEPTLFRAAEYLSS